METLARYFRLYGYFVRFSVSRSLQFRFDFFFRFFMDAVYCLVNILFYRILFLNSASVAGWNEAQAMIFVAGYCIVDALQMTLVASNIWNLTSLINKGDLDYYLVRPVSSLFFVSFRDFAANSFLNLVTSLGVLAWALNRYDGHYTLGGLALFLVLLFNGFILHWLMHLLTLLPTFWTHSGRGYSQIFWTFSRCSERPDRIFTGWARRVLTTVMPYALMTSFPTRLFLEPFDWSLFTHLVLVSVAFFGLVVFVWNRALRTYSSASS